MDDITFIPADIAFTSAKEPKLVKEMDFSSVGLLAHSLNSLREKVSLYEEPLTLSITKRIQALRKGGTIPTSLSEDEEVRQVRRFYHEVILSFLKGEYDENINTVKVKCLMPGNDEFYVQDIASCLDGFSYTGRLWLVDAVFLKYTKTEENKVLFDYIKALSSDDGLLDKIRSIAVFTSDAETTSCKAVAFLILEMLFLQMEMV